MVSAAPGDQILTRLDKVVTPIPASGPENVGTSESGLRDGVSIFTCEPNSTGNGVLNSGPIPILVSAV